MSAEGAALAVTCRHCGLALLIYLDIVSQTNEIILDIFNSFLLLSLSLALSSKLPIGILLE